MTLDTLINLIISDADYHEFLELHYDSVYEDVIERFCPDIPLDEIEFNDEEVQYIRNYYRDHLYNGLK